MIGLGVVELAVLAVVALGVFSVLGVLGFKVFEKLLAPERWQHDELSAGGRPDPGTDEVELMRDEQRWIGDRLTAVERKLPGLKKPVDGDPVDRLLERLPDVDHAESPTPEDGDETG